MVHECTFLLEPSTVLSLHVRDIVVLVTELSVQHWFSVYHHKHPGLGHLARSVSRVTVALSIVSSVSQLFSFLVVCSDMILKGFGFVAFFASVKTSSVCIHLSCPVCIQSVIHGVRSLLFCGHKWCSLLEVSITSFLPLQFFVSVRLSESSFLTHTKIKAKLMCCIISK